jgi:arylsulfatase
MKTTRTQNLMLACALAITAASALGQSRDGLDRTVLPIREPQYPTTTELDARNAKAPPRFEIKAPPAAPNVVIVARLLETTEHRESEMTKAATKETQL